MPFYEFEDEDGRRYALYLEMREAPGLGDWTTIGGKRLKRLPSIPVQPHVPDYTCTVRSQPRWDPTYPRYDAQGHGVILSKKEHNEYKAKNPGLAWE